MAMDIQRILSNAAQSLTSQKASADGQGQVAQTARTEGTAQAAAAAGNRLFGFAPGQLVAGNITDIRGSMIEIALNNNQIVTARLTENFEYVIGQRALFSVKSNDGKQLVLVPKDRTSMEQAGNLVLGRILGEAGMPISDRGLEMVRAMMRQQIPVDAATVQQYAKSLEAFPNASVETLVGLNQYQIPQTEEMVQQYDNYKNNEYQLVEQMKDMPQQMTELLSQMMEESPAATAQLFAELMDALELTTPQEDMVSIKQNPLTEEQRDMLASIVNPNDNPAEGSKAELLRLIQSPTATYEDILRQLQNSLGKGELDFGQLGNLFQNDGLRTLLNAGMDAKMLLDPRTLAEGGTVIQKFYQKLMVKTEKIAKLMEEYGKDGSSFAKSASDMNNNMKFMNSMNEMLNYVQLPIKLTEESAHGDLYVYTKKNQLHKKGEELTALLHLDLDHLGRVDVFIKMLEQKVTTDFTLESEELLDFMEAHIDQLNSRLQAKGYQITSTIALKKKSDASRQEKTENFFDDIVNRNRKERNLKRFSFDVRA